MTLAAQVFIDNLRLYLKEDANTSQWLLPLEPLLHSSYAHRFLFFNDTVYYNAFRGGGEKWMTAIEFYERSRAIVNEFISQGYYTDLNNTDVPTGELQ